MIPPEDYANLLINAQGMEKFPDTTPTEQTFECVKGGIHVFKKQLGQQMTHTELLDSPMPFRTDATIEDFEK